MSTRDRSRAARGAACALALLAVACGDDASGDPQGPLRIDRVEPPQAVSGEVVRLYGDGFGARQPDDGRVSLRGVCAPVVQWTHRVVTVEIPTDAGRGDTVVVLQRDGLASNPAALTLLGEGRFVAAAPCP